MGILVQTEHAAKLTRIAEIVSEGNGKYEEKYWKQVKTLTSSRLLVRSLSL